MKMAKMFPQKNLQIKTNPDNATDNILKSKASINWSVFQISYSFHYPKANFVLQLFHI